VRDYAGGAARDLHEADLRHLQNAEATYLEMVKLFPKSFTLIECFEGGKLLPIDQVHEKIWALVQAVLAH
jgi:hypothetical protein